MTTIPLPVLTEWPCQHRPFETISGWLCLCCGEYLDEGTNTELETRLMDAGYGSAGVM
jgi:hypothetical protein